MANQTVVSAAAIWQAFFDKLTETGTELDFIKQGEVYFVECNAGNDDYDGHDWEHAFKTLGQAIKVSNASISNSPVGYGRGWAARNKIYIKGDACDEDLSTGPQKCDVIGVGSCDAQPMARILGTQAFTSLGGCRFFNIEFWDDGASYNLTFTTCDGIEFHNCKFTCKSNSLGAIRFLGATGSEIVIEDCIFRPDADGNPFDTAAISLEQTTCNGCVIRNNVIEGDVGINIDCTNVRQAYVDRNTIVAVVGKAIDDASSKFYITNNTWICINVTAANSITYNEHFAANNIGKGKSGTKSHTYFPDLSLTGL